LIFKIKIYILEDQLLLVCFQIIIKCIDLKIYPILDTIRRKE